MRLPLWSILLLTFPAQLWGRTYSLADLLALVDQAPLVQQAAAETAATAARGLKDSTAVMDTRLGWSLMELDPQALNLDPNQAAQKWSLRQALPLSGRNWFAAGRAQANNQAAEAELVLSRRNLAAEVQSQFGTWQAACQRQAVLEQEAAVLVNLLALARNQYINGLLNQSSLTELEVRAAQNKLMLLEGETAVWQARWAIQTALGLAQDDFELASDPGFDQIEGLTIPALSDWLSAFPSGSPEFLKAQRAVAAARADSALAVTDFLPDVEVMAELTTSPMGRPSLAVGLEVPLSLFSAVSKTGAVTEANATVQAATSRLTGTELAGLGRVRALWKELTTNLAKLQVLRREVLQPTTENLKHMLAEYQQGKADLPTVYQTLVMSFDLKTQDIATRESAWKNLIDLETLTGKKILSQRSEK